eukprot:PhF_6_TR17034/c0_g3_i1/m.25884
MYYSVRNISVHVPSGVFGANIQIQWRFEFKYYVLSKAMPLYIFTTKHPGDWASCISEDMTVKNIQDVCAYMPNASYLDAMVNTYTPQNHEGWMCARENYEGDWEWTCGPPKGMTVRELGFSNW